MRMSQLLPKLLTGFLACLIAVGTLAETDPVAMEKLLNSLSTHSEFSADFKQMTLSDDGFSSNSVNGTLDIRRPNQFFWKALPPQEQEVISNGKILWVYDIDLEQVTIQDVEENLNQSPAVILSGNRELIDRQYYVNQLSEVEGLTRFRLTPKGEDNSLRFIDIELRGAMIQMLRFEDSLGQTTLIELQSHNLTPRFKKKHFSLVIPKGVDVLDQRR